MPCHRDEVNYKQPEFWKRRYCNNCKKFTAHKMYFRKGEGNVLDKRVCNECGKEEKQ